MNGNIVLTSCRSYFVWCNQNDEILMTKKKFFAYLLKCPNGVDAGVDGVDGVGLVGVFSLFFLLL
jgi:hypothetical protein